MIPKPPADGDHRSRDRTSVTLHGDAVSTQIKGASEIAIPGYRPAREGAHHQIHHSATAKGEFDREHFGRTHWDLLAFA